MTTSGRTDGLGRTRAHERQMRLLIGGSTRQRAHRCRHHSADAPVHLGNAGRSRRLVIAACSAHAVSLVTTLALEHLCGLAPSSNRQGAATGF